MSGAHLGASQPHTTKGLCLGLGVSPFDRHRPVSRLQVGSGGTPAAHLELFRYFEANYKL